MPKYYKIHADGLTFELEPIYTELVPDVREWIPVTERLPKNGEMTLCNTSYFVEVLQWDERAGVWCGLHRGYPKSYVTHWMPLPEPPADMRKVENDG